MITIEHERAQQTMNAEGWRWAREKSVSKRWYNVETFITVQFDEKRTRREMWALALRYTYLLAENLKCTRNAQQKYYGLNYSHIKFTIRILCRIESSVHTAATCLLACLCLHINIGVSVFIYTRLFASHFIFSLYSTSVDGLFELITAQKFHHEKFIAHLHLTFEFLCVCVCVNCMKFVELSTMHRLMDATSTGHFSCFMMTTSIIVKSERVANRHNFPATFEKTIFEPFILNKFFLVNWNVTAI